MAEAYCVKDKMKVEVVNPAEDHDEERQAGHLRAPARSAAARSSRSAADAALEHVARRRPPPATAGVVRFPRRFVARIATDRATGPLPSAATGGRRRRRTMAPYG